MTRKEFIDRLIGLCLPVIRGEQNGYSCASAEGCLLMRACQITQGRNGYDIIIKEAGRNGLGQYLAYQLARTNDAIHDAPHETDRTAARHTFTDLVQQLAHNEGIDLAALRAGGAA